MKIKEQIKNMFEELGACAVEQGHSITLEGRIHIDLSPCKRADACQE